MRSDFHTHVAHGAGEGKNPDFLRKHCQLAGMNSEISRSSVDLKGLLIALAIITLWLSCLIFLLNYQISLTDPLVYFGVLIQMHLYTGLFITSHDAMHGLVSSNKKLNKSIGWVSALLFSYNFYNKLFPKHHEHHRFVATDQDPDYHDSDNFFAWYFSFIKQYVTVWQILLMAVTFNILKLFLPTENLIVFWMLPAVLSTFQLFYFGTYLPHRGETDNNHHSTTQAKNHFWAFITCYFFGYHYEHHEFYFSQFQLGC